jgi:DNA-directed RNA polymerase subunit beta
MNKKLHIKNRLFNQRLAETLVDPETGEILAEEGTRLLIAACWINLFLT